MNKRRHRANDFDRNYSVTRDSGSDEPDIRYRSPLCFFPLELIEHQIAERIKNDAVRIAFNRLRHVRMMAHYDARTRVNGRPSEFLLPGVWLTIIFPTG